jgi:RNA polymerase sigma factor for flagellar operon FliA
VSAEASQTASQRTALQTKVRQAYAATSRDQQEEKWILENLSLVRRIVHRIASHISHREDIEDLVAAGTLGLVKAARAYDAGRDAQFKTYATIRVRGAVIDELRKRSFVPPSVGNQIRTVMEAYQNYCQSHGAPPSDEQLAAEVGISQAQLYRTLEEARRRHFLSIHGLSEEDSPLGRLAPSAPGPSPHQQVESRETAERLAKAIGELSERDRKVILLYYERELTMKEIAAVLGITESRVSHLHASALFKLSMKMRN